MIEGPRARRVASLDQQDRQCGCRSPPSGSAGTGDPRSPQTTVPTRDLVQVLLVIILSVVERFGLCDLGGDGSETAVCQNLKEEQMT